MKLLLVEDEIKTVDYLKRGLSEQGYNVDIAMNGLDGLHLAGTGQYEAIILDIMLPDLDGISLLKSIRPTNHTPVIMLTAKTLSAAVWRRSTPEPTTILSNLFRFWNCWRACRLSPAGRIPKNRPTSTSAICTST